jgi:hypothetical protein
MTAQHETSGSSLLREEEIRRRIAELANKFPDGLMNEQDQAARRLGYCDYNHYRKSSLWRDIRKRILERDERTCRCCWIARAKQVHHRTYSDDVMRGKNDAELHSVCQPCHELIHYAGDRWRESLEERDSILFNLE